MSAILRGRNTKKKWLVSFTDIAAMNAHLKVKNNIPLWCDGKESATDSQDDDERPQKKKQKKSKDRDTHTKTVNEQEEELERVFQKLRDKHGSTSCGQELLYPECTIMMIDPLMHLCLVQKQPTEFIVDAFTGAATVIAKAIVNPKALQDVTATEQTVRFSPGKKVDIRMKNLEQLRVLQCLMEDGILSQDESTEKKRIVLKSLNNLV